MSKENDVRNRTIPKSVPVTANKKSINPENTSPESPDSQDNTNQDRPDNISQDNLESTSPDSPDKTDSTSPESKNQTGNTKILKKEIEIPKPNPTIKKTLMYPSGTLKTNQALVQPAEPTSPRNLPHKLKKASLNPNPESLKPNKSPLESQPVMKAQEEEELSDVAEERLQLNKERNDYNLL